MIHRARRGHRTWAQRATLLACCGLVVGLLAAATGLGYAYAKYTRLARVELGSVLTERSSDLEAQNFLVVGIDSAANLERDDPVRVGREDIGGLRSDTIMLLRVDPAAERASLLSLPRDLWVPLASGGRNRINAAIESGGPEELIDTIEGYLGIPVNHYVQVDFAGFRGLVDVIGGVEVPFDLPARDRRSGLAVTEPGCVLLDPDQALAYVRSRAYETFARGRWRTDPTGDLGRISRQQDFIVRALRRAISAGLRNPVTLDDLVDAALATVTVDDLFEGDDIVALAARFRSFDADDLDLFSLPVTDDSIGGAAVLRLVDDEAQPILDLFRGTDPTEVTARAVRVQVLNGSGVPGQAREVSGALAAVGFTAAGTGEASSFAVERTVVRHTAAGAAAADLVARFLVAGAVLEEVAGPLGADVVVVTGRDFAGVRSEAVPASTSTTTARPGATSTLPSAPTTTTSVVGQVPQPPPGVEC